MAWIETRRTANGKPRYMVGYREPGTGKRVRKTFARKNDASAFRAGIEASLHRGEYVSADDRNTPLATFIADMLNGATNLRGSTLYGYGRTLERHIAPGIGTRSIGEITTPELRRYFIELDLGPSGKAGVYRLLAKAFNQAVRDGTLIRSPLRPIPKPTEHRKEIVPLTPAQVEALAGAADPRYRLPILLGAYAGLRAGEIGGLRVQDVDYEHDRLRIVQAVRTEGGRRMLGEVKTDSSRRQVNIPASITRELADYSQTFPPAADGRIFQTYEGGLVSHIVLAKRLATAARAAELPPLRFHLLRHSYAAINIAQGAHERLIQSQMGHTSVRVTMDVYGHLFEGLGSDLAQKLEMVRRDAVSRKGQQELSA